MITFVLFLGQGPTFFCNFRSEVIYIPLDILFGKNLTWGIGSWKEVPKPFLTSTK